MDFKNKNMVLAPCEETKDFWDKFYGNQTKRDPNIKYIRNFTEFDKDKKCIDLSVIEEVERMSLPDKFALWMKLVLIRYNLNEFGTFEIVKNPKYTEYAWIKDLFYKHPIETVTTKHGSFPFPVFWEWIDIQHSHIDCGDNWEEKHYGSRYMNGFHGICEFHRIHNR